MSDRVGADVLNNTKVIVGCVQLTPTDDRKANTARACEGVRLAASRGASLIVLPEYVTFLHASGKVMRSSALNESDDPSIPQFQAVAKAEGVWLVVGSIAIALDHERIVNRSLVISADGVIVARYDKIHMFDATLPNGRVIRESGTYSAGNQAVVVRTPWGDLGMSICYDLRFPALYRSLSKAGAQVLLVPSAFTKGTGSLHWHALLRARAIENGAYVVAAATCGTHPGGHETYGHALIVGPSGQVLASAADNPDVICAEVDFSAVTAARSSFPSLTHDRDFQLTLQAPEPADT